MRRSFLLLLVMTVTFCFVHAQQNQTFPIEKINSELKSSSSDAKVLVFMPSVFEETEYASMIIQAFQNYFIKKLAFLDEDREKITIDIILVSKKDRREQQEKNREEEDLLYLRDEDRQNIYRSLFDTQGMNVYYSIHPEIKEPFNLPDFEDMNSDSVLFLLDRNNTIIWRDDEYRGQGEHLKPLEYKIKELLGLPYPKVELITTSLQVGDKVPVTQINNKKISDYKGNILVLTFYPAAYSGIFDIKNKLRIASMKQLSLMSCSMHISSFDRMSLLKGGGVQYFAVSESTPELLNNWRESLDTHHIQYLNDPDYSISQAFGAYNPQGYNNRMTVIIDKEGKIAYIDKDYTFTKDKEIEEIVQKLLSGESAK